MGGHSTGMHENGLQSEQWQPHAKAAQPAPRREVSQCHSFDTGRQFSPVPTTIAPVMTREPTRMPYVSNSHAAKMHTGICVRLFAFVICSIKSLDQPYT